MAEQYRALGNVVEHMAVLALSGRGAEVKCSFPSTYSTNNEKRALPIAVTLSPGPDDASFLLSTRFFTKLKDAVISGIYWCSAATTRRTKVKVITNDTSVYVSPLSHATSPL